MSFASGVVRGVYAAIDEAEPDFVTAPFDRLDLTIDGVTGDRHAGPLRASGAREPWLPRGTMLRNDRQLSALSVEDLGAIATALDIHEADPRLIGANLVIEGLPDFSRIPAGSFLAIGGSWEGKGRFDGTAILQVSAYNHPCRGPGRKLAAAHGRPDLECAFPKAARSLRGLVLGVSLPGCVRVGDAVVLVPVATAP